MPRKPEYNREDLIDRAKALFWRNGWSGTSMKDLERSLKINPGSFYAAFGSKDALFELALDSYAQDSISNLRDLAARYGPLAALQRLPSLIISNELAPSKACMLSKTYLELHGRNHPLADRADKHLLAMEHEFEKLFAAAQAAAQIKKDHSPKSLAIKYQSDLFGLRVSAERPDVDSVEIATQMAEALSNL